VGLNIIIVIITVLLLEVVGSGVGEVLPITGESLAVDKYMADVCYYTTGCKRGKAYGIVTAIQAARIQNMTRTSREVPMLSMTALK
jgi:hypothetical protein